MKTVPLYSLNQTRTFVKDGTEENYDSERLSYEISRVLQNAYAVDSCLYIIEDSDIEALNAWLLSCSQAIEGYAALVYESVKDKDKPIPEKPVIQPLPANSRVFGREICSYLTSFYEYRLKLAYNCLFLPSVKIDKSFIGKDSEGNEYPLIENTLSAIEIKIHNNTEIDDVTIS